MPSVVINKEKMKDTEKWLTFSKGSFLSVAEN
jgi:hypothetical protein